MTIQQTSGLQSSLARDLIRDRWLYLFLLPGLMYFVLFKYVPMWGIVIAFQDYHPFTGVTNSPWVGFKHFIRLFTDDNFYMLLKNTLLLSFYSIVFVFPAPIIVALLLDVIRHQLFKRSIQTMIYIPHFISWVIVLSMYVVLFEADQSMFQSLLASLGMDKINFLLQNDSVRWLYVVQNIWKECGWGTIIYLAALAAVSPELYEAARMDGANRLQQMWHVTLPAIRSTIVIMLLLKISDILELGFDQVYVMLNSVNRETLEIFDTYVYRTGILEGKFSYSTAIGLFKSGVGLLMVLLANQVAKRFGEEGLF